VASQANLQAIYERLAGQLTRQFVVTYRSRSAAGAQVTVGVEAGGAADSAFVLMPPRPVGQESPEVTRPLLTGAVGLSIAMGLTFLTVFLLVAMVLGATARARRDRELARRIAAARLQGTAPATEPRAESGLTGWIPQPFVDAAERVAEVGGFSGYLEARLERAGLPLRAGELVSLSVIAAALGAFIGGLIFQSAVFAVVFAVAAGAVPYVWVNVAQARRVNRLHEQLPDALMILSSSMRAGHSFLQALDMVAKEIGDPAAPEFARVVAEIRLGRPVDEAMLAMADRVGTEEFRWAVMAVNVQREVGGNLAEILDTVAETVREREQVRRTIRVLSAEGRLSIRILVALPPLMVLYLVKVNPDYMRLLWTTGLGWVMVGVAVTLMTIGIFWARRIVKIDV
jgi:tight adherence protein B